MRNFHCLFCLAVILSLPLAVSGQEVGDAALQPTTGLHKNSMYGNVGMGFPLVSAAASVSYDRSLFRTADQTDFRLKLTVGYLGAMMDGHYNFQSLSVGFITGSNASHLELFAGAALNQHHPPSNPGEPDQVKIETGVFPSGNIGYRFQKPQGWFIFRA